MGSELKPCPFCQAPAEYDSMRPFRIYSSGKTSTMASVYCTQCNAEMAACYEDCDDSNSRESLLDLMIEAWNTRPSAPTEPTPDLVERVAFSMWKAEAERAAPNVAKNRTPEMFADALEYEREKWLSLTRAALAAAEAQIEGRATGARWGLGDLVQKKCGSSWRGKVVGFYATDHTPIGYAVDSIYEPGSVQVWPEAALEPYSGDHNNV